MSDCEKLKENFKNHLERKIDKDYLPKPDFFHRIQLLQEKKISLNYESYESTKKRRTVLELKVESIVDNEHVEKFKLWLIDKINESKFGSKIGPKKFNEVINLDTESDTEIDGASPVRVSSKPDIKQHKIPVIETTNQVAPQSPENCENVLKDECQSFENYSQDAYVYLFFRFYFQ